MQHQYWVTKKTVLKKLGTKEDECVVSSDAELDAKLELFRSISDSCLQLQKILDQYQERVCILAQEENSFGKFLRDAGKSMEAAEKPIVSIGKAISYSGQQRLSVRGPLLRLYHEVETFRARAVSDMRATVTAMEKARTEYRAALGWMKSTSAQLDPDTGRGLDNFRKAQRQVRESKQLFDKLTLDVLQKIDLLAAARCNMFSNVLANYHSSFLNFSTKVLQTLDATIETMTDPPQYEFSVLKELSTLGEKGEKKTTDLVPVDKDQLLFFKDEYKDNDSKSQNQPITEVKSDNNTQKKSTLDDPHPTTTLIDTSIESEPQVESSSINADLAGLTLDCDDISSSANSFFPFQMLQDLMKSHNQENPTAERSNNDKISSTSGKQTATKPKATPKKEDKAAWFKLFAELDPLANPDSLLGSNNTQSHAA